MVLEEEQKIWLLSRRCERGIRTEEPGEQSARRVYAEYETYSPENMPAGQYTEYLETKIGSYSGSGIYSGAQLRNLCDV